MTGAVGRRSRSQSAKQQNRQQEYSMDPQDNTTRIWQWLTLSLILFMALSTAYMIAVVGGVI